MARDDRPDVRPLSADSSEEDLRQGLIETISGFQSATTGKVCDYCNAGIAPDDVVFVECRFDAEAGRWDLIRTHCDDHDPGTSEIGTNAVVKCETGPLIKGEFLPLLNPEIVAFTRGDSV